MVCRCIRRLAGGGAIALAACLVLAVGAQAKPKTFTVCKHGCRYSTIQGAVNASGKNATISVKPGKYVEQFVDNKLGAAFNDINGTDFFNDGSGHGSCFANNGAVTLYSAADDPDSQLYPTCPATTGSGTTTGDPDQLQVIAAIVSQTTGRRSSGTFTSTRRVPG
jgi:hypothetical protein